MQEREHLMLEILVSNFITFGQNRDLVSIESAL
jgi:hypothetical protein